MFQTVHVLAPGGRLALIEPTPHHPLVNLYRRTLAPAAWRDITTYIGTPELATLRGTLARGHVTTRIMHSHLLGFLATPLAFALRAPRAFRTAERLLCAADRLALRIAPGLARRAWFVILHGRKDTAPPPAPPVTFPAPRTRRRIRP